MKAFLTTSAMVATYASWLVFFHPAHQGIEKTWACPPNGPVVCIKR